MSGVLRPYTFQDVIGALVGQSQTAVSQGTTGGFSQFGETAETVTMSDTMSDVVATPATYDNGVWGGFEWQ